MDRTLISLKFAMLRNGSASLRQAGWAVGALLVSATWTAAVLASSDARHTVLTLAFALWGMIAAIGPVLMSGAGVLRPNYFTLLPIPRGTLGRGLLMSVFVSIAAGFVLLTYFAAGVHAVALEPWTLLIVLLGAPLTWVLVVTASRLVYGLLGAAMRSRVGVEIASIQFGLMFAAMFAGWMIVQLAIETVPALLTRGIPEPTITAVLDAFPTSWTVLAIERAAAGDPVGAALLLGALALIDVVLVVVAARLLVPSTSGSSRRRRGRARSARFVAGGGILPKTQLGAVIGKELRQWNRDPWRMVETRSAVWTGLAIGLFAFASVNYAVVSPFAGLIVAFMLGIAALSLYGQDGSAIWQNIVGEDETSVRSDVFGRQLAPVLLFVPQAILISGLFLVLSGAYWSAPILLAALPAVLGAASGAAILVAAVAVSPGVDPRQRVGPNDAVGNISFHVWIVMLIVPVTIAPTVGVIVLSVIFPSLWLTLLAIAVGVLNGFLAAWGLGRIVIAYLTDRMPDLFSRIRYGQVFPGPRRGRRLLDSIERASVRNEQQYREQQQKERRARLDARS